MPYVLQRVIAAAALVVLSPLMFVIALAIAATMGWPVLYVGTRVGAGGERFEQLKFRSMVRDADSLLDSDGGVTSNRVTPLGEWLRRLSLDELPQLVNVARGDMALIGPRPLLIEVAEKVDDEHPRFKVLPGLSGLAQLSGRNMIPWSQRLDFDAEYVKKRSIGFDIRLLLRTVKQTVSGDGIAPDRNTSDVMDLS